MPHNPKPMQKEHIDILGFPVRDKVTDFKGVASTVSFDLYGCIQVVVTPQALKDGSAAEARWFDITRLVITKNKRVMEVPNFSKGYIAAGKKGPSEKPQISDFKN